MLLQIENELHPDVVYATWYICTDIFLHPVIAPVSEALAFLRSCCSSLKFCAILCGACLCSSFLYRMSKMTSICHLCLHINIFVLLCLSLLHNQLCFTPPTFPSSSDLYFPIYTNCTHVGSINYDDYTTCWFCGSVTCWLVYQLVDWNKAKTRVIYKYYES